MASLVPDEASVGGKRRLSVALDQEELIKPYHKRLRSNECEAPPVQEELSATNGNSNNLTEKDSQLVDGCPTDSSVTTKLDLLPVENASLLETATIVEPQQSSLPTLFTTDVRLICSPHDFLGNSVLDPSQAQSRSQDSDQAFHANSKAPATALQLPTHTGSALQESTGVSIPPCAEAQRLALSACDSSAIMATQSTALVPFPDKLFWSNNNNLCWLDSMLVALVNCKSLRKCQPQEQLPELSVWQLIQQYDAVSAAVQVHQKPGRG